MYDSDPKKKTEWKVCEDMLAAYGLAVLLVLVLVVVQLVPMQRKM